MREREIGKLSDLKIRNAKPKINDVGKAVESTLSDGGNLYLIIKPAGHKSWSFIYKSKVTGKQTKVGLGGYPDVGLAAARIAASDMRRRVSLGEDPRQAADVKKAASQEARGREKYTFRQLGEAWFKKETRDRNWSPGYQKKFSPLLVKHSYPLLGNKYIGDIDEALVSRVLRGISDRGTKETAIRVRGAIREVFDYACGLGEHVLPREKNFMKFADNVGGLRKPASKPTPAFGAAPDLHEAFGQYLRDVAAYRGRDRIVETALKLLPYLGQRPGQVWVMQWEQLDLEGWLWTCPPEIMKQSQTKKEDPTTPPHLVPLPRQAVELLQELEPFTGPTGYVFPGGWNLDKHISDAAVNKAIRKMGYSTATQVTGHSFRALMQTITQDALDIPKAWSDRHLAHKPTGPLSDRYDRSRFLVQRFGMAQQYADFLDFLADTAGEGAPNRIVRKLYRGEWVTVSDPSGILNKPLAQRHLEPMQGDQLA